MIALADRRLRGDTVNLVMSHLTCVGGKLRRRRAARPVDLRVQRARPASSPSPRTTWRSATCTGGRRCPRPRPCTTAARRSRWTSASRTTRASSAWSRPRPASRPGSPTSPSRRGGGCGPCAAPWPSLRRRPRASARTTCGCGCASRPAPGCATTPSRSCPTPWRSASTPSSRRRHGAATGRGEPAHDADPRAAVRRVLRDAGGCATRGSPPCSASCTTRSPPPTARSCAELTSRTRKKGISDAPDPAGHARLRVLPRAGARRLHRRRLLRPRRPDRRRASQR